MAHEAHEARTAHMVRGTLTNFSWHGVFVVSCFGISLRVPFEGRNDNAHGMRDGVDSKDSKEGEKTLIIT